MPIIGGTTDFWDTSLRSASAVTIKKKKNIADGQFPSKNASKTTLPNIFLASAFPWLLPLELARNYHHRPPLKNRRLSPRDPTWHHRRLRRARNRRRSSLLRRDKERPQAKRLTTVLTRSTYTAQLFGVSRLAEAGLHDTRLRIAIWEPPGCCERATGRKKEQDSQEMRKVRWYLH